MSESMKDGQIKTAEESEIHEEIKTFTPCIADMLSIGSNDKEDANNYGSPGDYKISSVLNFED